jgi:hypothetical protein
MKISIQDLMARSGVAFGTSGARGLATAMTDSGFVTPTRRGFLQYLESTGELKRADERGGGRRRSSTEHGPRDGRRVSRGGRPGLSRGELRQGPVAGRRVVRA